MAPQTELNREMVIKLYAQNKRIPTIIKLMGNEVNESFIRYQIKKFREIGSVKDKPRSGRDSSLFFGENGKNWISKSSINPSLDGLKDCNL